MPAFTFDFTLRAATTVEAETLEQARELLTEALSDALDCNGGAFLSGQTMLFEASAIDKPTLGMIDGELPDGWEESTQLQMIRVAQAFREAADGDSGDAEHDAAVEMADLLEALAL